VAGGKNGEHLIGLRAILKRLDGVREQPKDTQGGVRESLTPLERGVLYLDVPKVGMAPIHTSYY